MFAFYSELIEQVGEEQLRLYLYHIPPIAQVGFSLRADRTPSQALPGDDCRIQGQFRDFNNTLAVIQNFPELRVFPGSEAFLLDGLRAGGVGCITATGNINAKAIKEVHVRWKDSDAEQLQAAITRRRKIVEAHPLISAVKSILADKYADATWRKVRAPLLPLEGERARQLKEQLTQDGYASAAEAATA